MQLLRTQAVIVKRHDLAEANRLFKLVTADYGLVSAVAKGVKKPKSRLSGALQPLTLIDVALIPSKRGDLVTLRSARISKTFSYLNESYDRSVYAQGLITMIAKQMPEKESAKNLFTCLVTALEYLDEQRCSELVVDVWLKLQLAKELGALPDLTADSEGKQLKDDGKYRLSVEDGVLVQSSSPNITSDTIKAWRIMSANGLDIVSKISGIEEAVASSAEDLQRFADYHS